MVGICNPSLQFRLASHHVDDNPQNEGADDPDRHGVWGNLRGEDGKLRVARLDLEQAGSGPVCIPSIPIGASRLSGRKTETKRRRRANSRLERLVEGLKGRLDLTGSFDLASYPAYQSLPLCILAAVFHLSPKGEGRRIECGGAA